MPFIPLWPQSDLFHLLPSAIVPRLSFESQAHSYVCWTIMAGSESTVEETKSTLLQKARAWGGE